MKIHAFTPNLALKPNIRLRIAPVTPTSLHPGTCSTSESAFTDLLVSPPAPLRGPSKVKPWITRFSFLPFHDPTGELRHPCICSAFFTLDTHARLTATSVITFLITCLVYFYTLLWLPSNNSFRRLPPVLTPNGTPFMPPSLGTVALPRHMGREQITSHMSRNTPHSTPMSRQEITRSLPTP